jgi:hypothetical protein
MKHFILAVLLAICPVSIMAQNAAPPLPVVKTHKAWYKDIRVWTVIGISLGASAAATYEAHECRLRNGIAPCDGGYGEFKAREIVRAVSTVGEDAIALGMRHQDIAAKYWLPVALGFPAYNTYVAVHESLKGCPAGEEFLYGTKFTCVPENYWGNVKIHNMHFTARH